MSLWEAIALGFIIGSSISFVGFCFISASGKFNKEYEAYREGYNDGLNAKKDKEKEVA